MQAVYLIRHGEPDFKDGKCALGKLDLDLSKRGYDCLSLIKPALDSIPERKNAVSPLKRAIRSAEAAGISDAKIYEDLYEFDLGEWDGLKFSEIKERWPKEYAERGSDLVNYQAPGGENLIECRSRVSKEFRKVLADNRHGSIFVFSHNAVAKMIMSDMCSIDPGTAFNMHYDYGESIQFLLENGKCIGKPYIGPVMKTPDKHECEMILKEAGTLSNIIEHTHAVAERAASICRKMNKDGWKLDEDFVYASAFLHDIKRTEKKHAVSGACLLLEKGYGAIASVIGDHMDIPENEIRISEKSLVFLADKLVKRTEDVSLKDRYFKGKTKEQAAFSKIRYEKAKRVYDLYSEYL